MSFNIIMQQNNSERNKINKDITNIETLTGNLRATTSIIDPVIVIEGDLSDYVDCNYMTIEEFNRSYFITNIRSLANDLIEITAHVDVLYSFKDEILNNTGIIRRQEEKWNLYVDDAVFRTYQNPVVYTQPFPQGFGSPHFILAVAGN